MPFLHLFTILMFFFIFLFLNIFLMLQLDLSLRRIFLSSVTTTPEFEMALTVQ